MKTISKKSLSKQLTALAVVSLFAAAAQAQTVLLNDTFSDNTVTGQSLPGSANWYFPTNGGSLSGATGAMVMTDDGAGAPVAYFTSTSLANMGDKVTLSFDFSFSAYANSADSFRFGLFNSQALGGATKFASSTPGANLPLAQPTEYAKYDGYATFANLGGGTMVQKEEFSSTTSTSTNTLFSAAGTLGTPSAGTISLTGGQNYTAVFSIERTATGNKLTTTIDGVTVTATDITSLKNTFDTVSFFTTSAAIPSTGGKLTLDNINVTAVTAVPEPSTYAMFIAGGLALIGAARRRRAKSV